jgi:hypothetical protein
MTANRFEEQLKPDSAKKAEMLDLSAFKDFEIQPRETTLQRTKGKAQTRELISLQYV